MRLLAVSKTNWAPVQDWYPLRGVFQLQRFRGISQNAGFGDTAVYMYMLIELGFVYKGTRHDDEYHDKNGFD